ncbi:unnamed protein product [Discula destructiva]
MGCDCGFDIVPPLKPNQSNQDKYERFVRIILEQYGSDEGDGQLSLFEEDRVARIVPKPNGTYIEFDVGEHPILPYAADMCHYFLRFSSKISGTYTARAEHYIRGVARIAEQVFGERVKWWHEQAMVDDKRMIFGYYPWTLVNAVDKRMRGAFNCAIKTGAAESELFSELDDSEEREEIKKINDLLNAVSK